MTELIVALDFPDRNKALSFVDSLGEANVWLKIGLQLFIAAGPALVEELKRKGFRVFLDLKLYDIPNTVFGAVQSAREMGVDMLTLHLQGGEKMCRKAIEALDGQNGLLLAGVTALTSFGAGEMPCIEKTPQEVAAFLACCAKSWGLPAIVCSGREVADVKRTCPGLLCVCPGIRLEKESAHDQNRVVSPGQAAMTGADFIVMGRSIIHAANPALKIREIEKMIEIS